MANEIKEAKKPVGRPAKERNEEHARIVGKMSQNGLPQEEIADYFDMCVETLQRLYGDELKRGRTVANNNIAQRLYDKGVREGDTTALIFMAKTRLGWREVNRTELTSPDGSMSPMQDIKVEFVSADEVKARKNGKRAPMPLRLVGTSISAFPLLSLSRASSPMLTTALAWQWKAHRRLM